MLFFSRARALARAREKKRNPKEKFEAKNAGQKISDFESAVRTILFLRLNYETRVFCFILQISI
jgi:hypothetical protein